MIYDLLTQHTRYHAVHPLFAKAFEALEQLLSNVPEKGRYEIEGENLFYMVNEYETIPFIGAQMEAHRSYIDIQVLVTGQEQIGIALKDDRAETKAYDASADYALFGDECSHFLTLLPGQFCVFFPEDLHMPNLVHQMQMPVKKLVMKVKVTALL